MGNVVRQVRVRGGREKGVPGGVGGVRLLAKRLSWELRGC